MRRRILAAYLVALHLAIGGVALHYLRPTQAAPSPNTFDHFGRLVAFPGKAVVPCPVQDARTEVILALGQSNAANYAGQRYVGGPAVVNFFGGKCYAAASPLLGSSGTMGESWTLLANKLIAAGAADRVVLVSSAIGSTEIMRWAAGGDLHGMLAGAVDGVKSAGYRPTRVIWHQGESDFLAGTSAQEYRSRFGSIVSMLRAKGVTAPVYVAVASFGEEYRTWTPDNPTAQAQRSLPGVRAVVDTDSMVTVRDRYDGVHFAATGQEKFTDALLRAFAEAD